MIHIEGLTRCYGDIHALHGIDLQITAGELVGLIGPSGAGKSTLLRVLNGFVAPTSGTVKVAGKHVGGLDRAGLRRLRTDVGMVYQQFHLVRRASAVDNVLSGAVSRTGALRTWVGSFHAADRLLAFRALQRVGLLERHAQRTDTLSGGQQQRVAIARTLVHDPRLVLADEPVASLDPRSSERILTLLRELAEVDGRTVIVSLHQVDLAQQHCHRVVGLCDGRVVLDAPAASVSAAQLSALYDPDGAPEETEAGDGATVSL